MIPLVMASYSRTLAEIVKEGQRLLDDGGIESIVTVNSAELSKMLREDLSTVRADLLAEAAKAKKQ